MAAKLETTRYPGIYRRGSSYVIIWEHRGQQHKETFATMAEAREKKGGRQSGEKRPVSKILFGPYFTSWIKGYAGRTSRGFSETTRPEYERPIKAHALPQWKAWKLADVEPADVRELFAEMREDGCSTSQIKKLRAALSVMFATAVEDGLRPSNPILGVRIPAARGRGAGRREGQSPDPSGAGGSAGGDPEGLAALLRVSDPHGAADQRGDRTALGAP